MTVHINNEAHHFSSAVSLEEALIQLSLHQSPGIAVAINEEVVPKQDWNKRQLNDQDELLIITATQGG